MSQRLFKQVLGKTEVIVLSYPLITQDLLIRYRDVFQAELTDSELAEIAFLQEKLNKHMIAIALFGMVSRGKTSLLNALFGQKLGETGAINGVTKAVSTYVWKIPTSSDIGRNKDQKLELQLIDTQGLDEVGGEIGGIVALESAKRADLILFVITGDLTRLEQEAITKLQTFYKPILLVFNKADLYSESDREALYEALQNEEMRKLISPQEIIFTVAEPLPVKVRLQYRDGRASQEVWEQPQPDVQALKERIVALLNAEGKALLSINVLRSLLEIQNTVTQRYVQKLKSSSAIAAIIFMGESLGLLLSPSAWIDGAISGISNGIFALWAISKYPSQKKYLWFILIIAIASLSGALGIDYEVTRYLQILWTGLSIAVLFKGIISDLENSRSSGNLSAKKLIAEIIQSAPDSSILKRFENVFGTAIY
jgi:small GTP-binding protein